MASNVTFFTPVDPIDINTLLTLEGASRWIIQTASPSTTKDFKNMLKADGDQAAWKAHNTRTKVSAVYKCEALAGNLTLPKVGLIAGGYHIDSWKLVYGLDYPQLSVEMHKHDGASTHAEGSCHTYGTALVLPAQFGVPSSISSGDAAVQFALLSPAVGMKSLTVGLSCSHVDELGGDGDWLAGENHDGVETLDVQTTGVIETADLTIGADWHTGTDGNPTGNTSVNSRSLNMTRHIAREA